MLVGRGSDEAIDLLVRAFCRAGQDAVLIICPPTFGMYAVAARIQGAEVVTVPLRSGIAVSRSMQRAPRRHAPNVEAGIPVLAEQSDRQPARRRGHVANRCCSWRGRAIVVVDEAYIEFAGGAESASAPRLATESRRAAHAVEGTRACRRALRHAARRTPEIVALLRKVIPPYAIPQLTVEAVLRLLGAEAAADPMRERSRSSSRRARTLWRPRLHRAARTVQSVAERRQFRAGTISGCRSGA